MIGDRVAIVSSLMFETKDEILPVYRPIQKTDGTHEQSYDGSYVLERAGGVKSNSTGTIQGEPIKVHRSQLVHLQTQVTSLGGTNDFSYVVPVFLDSYQQVGWFPTDHVRVVGGGRLI